MQTSTCYVNCNQPNGFIEEKLYDMPFDGQEVIDKVLFQHPYRVSLVVVMAVLFNISSTCVLRARAAFAQVRRMTAAELTKITDTGILRDWPNTYTFTKFIAEHMVGTSLRTVCRFLEEWLVCMLFMSIAPRLSN